MGITTLLIFTAVKSTPYEASQHCYFASQIVLRLERRENCYRVTSVNDLNRLLARRLYNHHTLGSVKQPG